MFIKGLFNYFLGYVILKTQGQGVEKLINLALARGILIWDLKDRGEYATFKTYLDNYFLLVPLCRKARARIKIEKKVGFPFLLSRLKKRLGLVVGLFLFVGSLYLLSNLILFIEVKGNEQVDTRVILNTARELGVVPGRFKRGLDFQSLERDFLIARREFGWVGFYVKGTKLLIEVSEKQIPPKESGDLTSDLVASRDGLVEKVLVLAGSARVKEGDKVKEGQLLISGYVYEESGASELEANNESREAGRVRARGEVWCRVWYEFFSTVPLTETLRERSGESTAAYIFIVGDREINIGTKSSPYRNYEREIIKRRVKWRNLDTPIEFITMRYYELFLTKKELTRDEALYKAREALFSQAEKILPPHVEILAHEVTEITPSGEEEVTLRLTVETLEEITLERKHEIRED
ncbi:MAG TPA: sporulation protein YqfD [Firmicutes bacterium]|nr:sporulation protein YqfD [Bacillota bacterium]